MSAKTALERAIQIESAESQSWLSLYTHCPVDYRKQYRIRCENLPYADCFMAANIDVLAFNRVLMLGLNGPATMNDIRDVMQQYREYGVRRMFIQVSPYAQPADLEEMLVEAGFRHYNNWVKWYVPLDNEWEEDPAVSILKVTPEMAPAFGTIVTSGFGFDDHLAVLATAGVGRPGWAYFVASIDGAPAGCAAGYIHNSVCALGWAATLPEYRNRGIQNALIHYRLNHLRDAGCTLATLETAEDTAERPSPSYRNMVRNGFTEAYHRKNYLYEFE